MISNGYTVTKKKKTDFTQMLVPTAIILILGSIFIAIFFLGPIQYFLYKPTGGEWFFEPPKAAYYAFIASILMVALMLIVTAIAIYKDSMTKIVKLMILFGYIGSVAILLLSLNQYHYADQSGIVINRFLSFEDEKYSWEDVTTVEEQQIVKNGIMSSGNVTLTFSNDKNYTFLLNENVRKAKMAMYFELEKQGLEVKRTQK